MHFHEIIYMGGFGAYVWPAYGITFFIFGLNILSALLQKRHTKKILQQFFKDENPS